MQSRLTVVLAAMCLWPLAVGAGERTAAELEARLNAKLAERRRRAIALARLYYASGDWQQAAAHYEAARRLRDDDIQVLTQLMRLYAVHRQDAKLLSPLKALVRLQPTSVGWRRELGSCYFRLGRRKEAETAWRTILDIYPNRAGAWRYLGQAYARHNLPQKAIGAFREALALNPRDRYVRLQLAEGLGQAGEHLDALAALAPLKAASSSNSSRRAAKVRQAALRALALPRPVRDVVEKLVQDAACSPTDLAWSIAQALERHDEKKRAADLYRRVADAEPKSARGKAAAAKAKYLTPRH